MKKNILSEIKIITHQEAANIIYQNTKKGKPSRVFILGLNEEDLFKIDVSLYADSTRPFIYIEIFSAFGYFNKWQSWQTPEWFNFFREAADLAWDEYILSGKWELDRLRWKKQKHRRLSKAKSEGVCKYVRFGDIPKGGRSWNSRDQYYESGVSVYRAIVKGKKAFIIMPEDAISTLFITLTGKQIYQVEGKAVGYGADGEVVLADARIISKLTSYELVHTSEVDEHYCDDLLPTEESKG